MPNVEITNNAPFGVVLWEPVYQDETLTSAAAATWAPGTLLGRITASDKLTAYTVGASDGSQIPVAVTTTEVVFTAGGDQPERPLISGHVRLEKLVADGVGPISKAEADALRSYGIIPRPTSQQAQLDNPSNP